MNRSIQSAAALAFLFCAAPPSATAEVLTPAETLRVTFTIDNGWTGVAPDVIRMNFGLTQVLAAYTARSATLFDGANPLGTDVKTSFGSYVGPLNLDPSNAWVDGTSIWSFKNPAVVDFTSILDGSIQGVIEFTIQTGAMDIPLSQVNLTMIRGTGPSSGTVVSPAPTVTSVNIVGGGVGTSYCISTPNSSGLPALISGSGSTSVAGNDLHLSSEPVPALQNGVFFYGPDQQQMPFGNGFLCIGAGATGIARLPIVQASVSGVIAFDVDYSVPPTPATTIAPGSTWNFSNWFRDPAGGGAFFNLSDGLEITFTP